MRLRISTRPRDAETTDKNEGIRRVKIDRMGGYSAPAGTGGAAGRKRNRSESANPQFQGGAAAADDDAGGWVDEEAENNDDEAMFNGNGWLPGGGGSAGATQQQVLDKLMGEIHIIVARVVNGS